MSGDFFVDMNFRSEPLCMNKVNSDNLLIQIESKNNVLKKRNSKCVN